LSAGFDEGSPVVLRRLWPRTRKGWGFVILTVSTFFSLDTLALMGSEIAIELLISLAGMLVGMVAAHTAAYPLREKFGGSAGWRMSGILLGLASVFGILLIGSTLADVPTFPTAESGNVGFLVYGLAFGFGVYFGGNLSSSRATPATEEKPGVGPEFRVIVVAAGAVAALFMLAFAAFVLFEYVAAPLIRYVAQ
jgi:hypothetical protein